MPKKIFQLLIYLLQALSLYFVFRTILANRSELLQLNLTAENTLMPMLLAMLFFNIVILLPIQGYRLLLQTFAAASYPFHKIAELYGRSALAKYLPGNVFHIVGRQILGKEMRIAQLSIATASFFEIVLHVFSASLISWFFMVTGQSFQIPGIDARLATNLLFFAAVGAIILIALSKRINIPVFKKIGLPKNLKFNSNAVFPSAFYYLLFILSNAIVYVYLRGAIFPTFEAFSAAPYLAAFTLSFLVGYVTPGAPGGIGVREALLVLFLSPFDPPAIVAATALAHRISWISAELIFAYIAVPLLNRQVE